jgi:predicted unusual protein kinase regulating ubiquinone biosynthesis (AarF/ABC1/UbiB family)
MERIVAKPLLEWAQTASQDERDQVGSYLFELLLLELFEFHFSQTDPNPANFQFDTQRGQIILLDFGAAREVAPSVSAIYRLAFAALLARDPLMVSEVVVALGVHNPELPEATELIVEMALESAEAFDVPVYDFAATDLQKRLNAKGRKMARFHGSLKTPPPEYLFFQRKLTGIFLICRQLGARVPCRSLVERHISTDH